MSEVFSCYSTCFTITRLGFTSLVLNILVIIVVCICIPQVYELLDKVNYLLPSGVFIEVSSSLMQHELLSVRRKALELFNNKLHQIDVDTLPDDQVQ